MTPKKFQDELNGQIELMMALILKHKDNLPDYTRDMLVDHIIPKVSDLGQLCSDILPESYSDLIDFNNWHKSTDYMKTMKWLADGPDFTAEELETWTDVDCFIYYRDVLSYHPDF